MAFFELHCQCGSSAISLEIDNYSLLRVICKKCNSTMVEQGTPQKTLVTESTPSPQHQDIEGKTPIRLQVFEANKKFTARKFGNYGVLKTLGEGGGSRVFLAVDGKTQEHVALKVLYKVNEKALKYMAREIQLLLKLDHPNIVALKDWGNVQGRPYMVMEYLPGSRTLEDILADTPLRPIHAVNVMYHILNALIYASQYQVIHRDIKPANILITDNGMVKLIDLGIGKMLTESGELTKTGEIMGTGYYMPPEQLRDAKRTDFRADIYAVGATLFHAVCGTPPYAEYANQLSKLVWGKINNRYISLGERNAQVPQQFIEIVEKAMAHRAEDRYETLEDMKEQLAAFHRHHSKKT